MTTPTTSSRERPVVSVVLATLNEAAHVRSCMDSLLAQQAPDFDLEILAVDGGSTDGTREYLGNLAALHPHVRVLTNPDRRAPFAFNIGISQARGQYVCIFGSHTVYKSDYISVCLRELIAKDAIGCGGKVLTEPSSDAPQARLVAYALAHPFGSSRRSFRTQPEGFADAVNYMVLRRDALIETGGYSESLLRNQDNDLNQRLRAKGHRLFCTWETSCVYHPKETVRELFRYGYVSGYWNVLSFRENPASMGLRHFVPFFFVVALLVAAALSMAGFLASSPPLRFLALSLPTLLLLHFGIGLLAASQVIRRTKFVGALWLPLIFVGFHCAYGLGSLAAIAIGARPPKPSRSSLSTIQQVRQANDLAEARADEST